MADNSVRNSKSGARKGLWVRIPCLAFIVCSQRTATIALRIAWGRSLHLELSCCKSASINADESQLRRPACSAFAARHISQSTQLQVSQLLDAKSGSGSNPVAPTILQSEPFGDHVEGLSLY